MIGHDFIGVHQEKGAGQCRKTDQVGVAPETRTSTVAQVQPPGLEVGDRSPEPPGYPDREIDAFQLGGEQGDVPEGDPGRVQVHPHVHPAHELVVVGPARGGELEPPKEFRFRGQQMKLIDADPPGRHMYLPLEPFQSKPAAFMQGQLFKVRDDGVTPHRQAFSPHPGIGNVDVGEIDAEPRLFHMGVMKGEVQPVQFKGSAKHGRIGSGGGRVRPQHVVEQLGQVAARPTGHGPQSEPAIAQAEGPDTEGPGPRGIPDIRKVQALHMDQRIALEVGHEQSVQAQRAERTELHPLHAQVDTEVLGQAHGRPLCDACLHHGIQQEHGEKGHHDQQNDRTQAQVTYRTPQRSICLDRAQVARSFARVTQGSGRIIKSNGSSDDPDEERGHGARDRKLLR